MGAAGMNSNLLASGKLGAKVRRQRRHGKLRLKITPRQDGDGRAIGGPHMRKPERLYGKKWRYYRSYACEISIAENKEMWIRHFFNICRAIGWQSM
jgi:hypothetical protein